MPILPNIKSKFDYSNFADDFINEQIVDTPVIKRMKQDAKYEGFTYIRSYITDNEMKSEI